MKTTQLANTKRRGFTLIELLVVIAIIGLLSTLAVVALGSARQKARDSKRLSDLKQVQTALELYYTDNNSYPSGSGTLGAGSFACMNSSGFAASGCANAYMGMVPTDPQTSQSYSYSATGTSPTTYTISGTLEGEMGGLSAGAITVTPAGISN